MRRLALYLAGVITGLVTAYLVAYGAVIHWLTRRTP